MALKHSWHLLQHSWTLTFSDLGIDRLVHPLRGYHLSFGVWLRVSVDRVDEYPKNIDTGKVQYEPLQARRLRLLHLQPGKGKKPLEGTLYNTAYAKVWDYRNPIPYEALSYTWGSPTTPSTITLSMDNDGAAHPMPITANLADALHALRLPDQARVLWIDSICIDQSNLEERNQQVGVMDSIYNHASLVLVYLGPSTSTSTIGMQILRFFAEKPGQRFRPSWMSEAPELVREGLEDIMRRAWFERMWVVQEAGLARKIEVVCGEDTVSWDADDSSIVKRIRSMIQYSVLHPSWREAGLADIDLSPLLRILDMQLSQQLDKLRHGYTMRCPELLDFMYDLRDKIASDSRDMIFAVRGLIDMENVFGGSFEPDYGLSLEENYERLWNMLELWKIDGFFNWNAKERL